MRQQEPRTRPNAAQQRGAACLLAREGKSTPQDGPVTRKRNKSISGPILPLLKVCSAPIPGPRDAHPGEWHHRQLCWDKASGTLVTLSSPWGPPVAHLGPAKLLSVTGRISL